MSNKKSHFDIKTPYNASDFPKYMEVNHGVSMTVPDQTMSLKTLVDRYARGLPVTGSSLHPVYHGDEEVPDLKRMDLSEIQDLTERVNEEIRRNRETLMEENRETQKRKYEEEQQKLFRKWQKEEQNQTQSDKPTRKPKADQSPEL